LNHNLTTTLQNAIEKYQQDQKDLQKSFLKMKQEKDDLLITITRLLSISRGEKMARESLLNQLQKQSEITLSN